MANEVNLRILHITDSYWPSIGGLERAVRSLATLQAAGGGTRVAVLTAHHPDETDLTIDADVTVFRRGMVTQRIPGALEDIRRPFHPTVVDPLFRRGISEVIGIFEPDVIHCHGWSLLSAITPARRAGIPIVATAHDYSHICAVKQATFSDGTVCSGPSLGSCVRHARDYYGAKGIPLALGLRTSVSATRSVQWTAISRAVANFGTGTAYQMPAMQIVPSYVEDDVFDYADAARPTWAPEADYLLFVGALTPYKGLQLLLDAHQKLQAEGLRLPLMVIGVPRKDTPNLDLPGVTVRNSAPHAEVMAAWRHATIGLVPSLIPEAFGQVVVECMAAGTPVIASGHGGIIDIVDDGVQGVLIPPNDVDALAGAIRTLWAQPETRAAMGAAGMERARRFTTSVVKGELDVVYADAIAAGDAR